MARTISPALRRALLMPGTADGIAKFVTITHASLSEAIRIVSDGTDFEWQGERWIGFPFKLGVLSDEEAMPKAQIEVQNVDRKIGDALQIITSPARLRLDLLAASEFDQTVDPRAPLGTPPIEYTANHLFLVNISVNAETVTGDVVSWDYTQSTYPARRATQDRYPGLFR